jgi:hypothetical protein
MTSSDISIISPLLCKNLTIQTAEKIQPSNLYNFLTTSLQINDIILDIDDKIFYYYISECSIYEIYIINTTEQYIITQADVFKESYSKDLSSIDLFITNDYFVVYKNTNLYFFKENKNYAIDDILSFIKYKYKINIDNINIINQNQINMYEKKFQENKHSKYLIFNKKTKSNFMIYFIVYLSIILSASIYYNYIQNKQDNKILSKIIYKNNNNILFEIIKLCNQNKLKIVKLKYQNNYYLQISSKNKKSIDKFLQHYKNRIKIKNIYLNDKMYILEIEIES